jgi:hypothetical protein
VAKLARFAFLVAAVGASKLRIAGRRTAAGVIRRSASAGLTENSGSLKDTCNSSSLKSFMEYGFNIQPFSTITMVSGFAVVIVIAFYYSYMRETI